jgi:ribonuclease P protein component
MNDGSGERFPAVMRLKKRADFQRVRRTGVPWKGPLFSLQARVGGEQPRLGIITPRRLGTAVERNRMKRVFREAFRRNASRFPAMDIVVLPKKACLERDARELERLFVGAVLSIAGEEENR